MIELLDIPLEWLIIISLNFLLILFLLILNLVNRSKINKIVSKYNKLMSGLSDGNLEQLLENCIENLHKVSMKNKEIELQVNNIERNVINCIQKVGVIRFNAFDNVGSDLSFAVSLLDNNDNGVVISSIYSRESSSTYAKPIQNGKSKYTLSAEELQAIDSAKKIFREKPYIDN